MFYIMFDLENHCYTVSEVTASIKMLLESRFPQVLMEGEVSNYRPSSAGHCYFTLKDHNSTIQAVIFRNDAIKLNFKPADGMKVKVSGRISVYPQRGNYQIICNKMDEQGKGNILAILEERKRKLAAEGLFDSQYKKELPLYPETLVVITSPTGAALRDILQVMNRRNSTVQIKILPTAVQGESAAPEIVKMIELANREKWGDLIMIARGGGSLEDLLPFSEENVVRAISSSYLPVITGIGHEIDFSLSDFASDLRAPTPSAAAELVCESSGETLNIIHQYKSEMSFALQARIKLLKEMLKPFKKDEILMHFRRYLDPIMLNIDETRESLKREMTEQIWSNKHRIALLKTEMEGHSPQIILNKGYSLVTDTLGNTITSSKKLKKGDNLNIRFAEGRVLTAVEEIE